VYICRKCLNDPESEAAGMASSDATVPEVAAENNVLKGSSGMSQDAVCTA